MGNGGCGARFYVGALLLLYCTLNVVGVYLKLAHDHESLALSSFVSAPENVPQARLQQQTVSAKNERQVGPLLPTLKNTIAGWVFFVKPPTHHNRIDYLRGSACVGEIHPYGSGFFVAPGCSDDCAAHVLKARLADAARPLTLAVKVTPDLWRFAVSGQIIPKSEKRKANLGSNEESENVSWKVIVAESCNSQIVGSTLTSDWQRTSIDFGETVDGFEITDAGETAFVVSVPHSWSSSRLRALILHLSQDTCVVTVEKAVVMRTANYYASRVVGGIPSGGSGRNKLEEMGLDGSGEVVSVGDTGLDYTNCYFYDPNSPIVVNSYNAQHRKIVLYATVGSSSAGDSEGGHGTHVTGTLTGDVLAGYSTSSDATSMQGNNGVAPKAKLAFVDLRDESSDQDSDTLTIPTDLGNGYFKRLYDPPVNARVSSNSWGGSSNAYSSTSREVDRFVSQYDTFITVFAAGNEGTQGMSTVNSPGTAKNTIAVGASLNEHNSFEALYNYMRDPLNRGYTGLKVEDPADEVSGLYNVTAAVFGIRGFNNAVKASLVMAVPSTACSAISNNVQNKMVLVMRGDCTFDIKANKVVNAGGLGIVVIDTVDSVRPVLMGLPSNVQSPTAYACSINRNDGGVLKEALQTRSLIVEYPVTQYYFSEDVVAAFSSRGPTLDGRIKPDLVAPGEYIYSAKADTSLSNAPTSTTCSPSNGLSYLKGSSMSAPVVAGAAALVRQFYQQGFYNPGFPGVKGIGFEPKAALVKATLLASTYPLRSVINTDTNSKDALSQLTGAGMGSLATNRSLASYKESPSISSWLPGAMTQGFGALSLGSLLPDVFSSGAVDWLVSNSCLTEFTTGLFVSQSISLSTGEEHRFCFNAPPGSSFRATLVWTDPAGSIVSSRALVNDLDLLVFISSGDTFLGNGRPQRDSLNNVEMVDLPQVQASAQVTVVVSGADVPFGPQTFALVVRGSFSGQATCSSSSCPSDCSGHGTCVAGKCQCDTDYAGIVCSVPIISVDYSESRALIVNRDVQPDTWSYFRIEVTSSMVETDGGVAVNFGRFSQGGDPDYYLRFNAIPTTSEYDKSNTECDTCDGATTAGRFVLPSTPGTYYLGVYGFCCQQSDIKVAVSNASTSVCGVIGCAIDIPTEEEEESCNGFLCNRTDTLILIAIIAGGVFAVVVAVILVAASKRRRRRSNTPRRNFTIRRTNVLDEEASTEMRPLGIV